MAFSIGLFLVCKQHGVRQGMFSAAALRQLLVELLDMCTLQLDCIDSLPTPICYNLTP